MAPHLPVNPVHRVDVGPQCGHSVAEMLETIVGVLFILAVAGVIVGLAFRVSRMRTTQVKGKPAEASGPLSDTEIEELLKGSGPDEGEKDE